MIAPYVGRYVRRETLVKMVVAGLALGGAVFGLANGVLEGSHGRPYLVGGLLALLFGSFHAMRALLEWRDPSRTKLGRDLARHGDLAIVTAEIERAVQDPATERFDGGAVLTPTWLVFEYGIGLAAVPWREVAWVYPRRTTYKVTSVRVAALEVLLVRTFEGRYSKKDALELTCRPSEMDAISAKIKSRAPGAVVGYEPDLAVAWEKGPRDAHELIRKRTGSAT